MNSSQALSAALPIIWPPLPFFLSASIAATYIFTAPTCTTTILHYYTDLEPYALIAEFQHFIPRFNKTSSLCGPHSGDRGWKEVQRHDNFKENSDMSTHHEEGGWPRASLCTISVWCKYNKQPWYIVKFSFSQNLIFLHVDGFAY